jgi:hypothetical protein
MGSQISPHPLLRQKHYGGQANPMASQAPHKMDAPSWGTASRIVVPEREGEPPGPFGLILVSAQFRRWLFCAGRFGSLWLLSG